MKTKRDCALVTGASSGIGLEMARLLAERGYDLVLVSRSAARLEELAETLRKAHGVSVWVLPSDLSAPGSAQRVAEFTGGNGIEVDVLINNAGVGLYGEHLSLDLAEIDRMLQLNMIALCDLCFLYGQEMKQRRKGRILNIASTAAYQPAPFLAAYAASKAFVLSFSEALAKELEDDGVTISCLSPGPTDTGFFHDFDKRGIRNGFFDKDARVDARRVAEIGIRTMLQGKLSRIVGAGNYFQAASVRFAPRPMVANISKNLMKPKGGNR